MRNWKLDPPLSQAKVSLLKEILSLDLEVTNHFPDFFDINFYMQLQ